MPTSANRGGRRVVRSRLSAELSVAVGSTRIPLDAVATHLRVSETNIGNLVADAMRANVDAEAAITNAGGIRGDRVYPPGPILRRTLIEMSPFGNVVCKLALPGRVILAALNYGVSRLPQAAGQFPQISGTDMRVDIAAAAGDRVRDVRVGGSTLDPDKTYTVAIADYMLNGGDGYTMFAGQRVLTTPENGDTMVTALEKYVTARREVAPAVEGRIKITP